LKELRYRYAVSLAITHPTMPAERIGEALRMSHDHCGSFGADRFTPKGNPLPGKYKHSFWRRSLAVPNDDDLEQFLASTVEQLEPHSEFFTELIAEGGSARLFIGLFLEQMNIGIELSPELQGRCSHLGISLGFDLYGPDPPGGAA
jgi:hypothetical protein